jgi:iron complex transport system ATP-binding protein
VSLQLDGVCVEIAGRRIVSDIDLCVQDGCFAGLLGPNGSGKSTILKAIYRVHQPSEGRVLLDGGDLPSLPARQAARRLAVVTQESTVEFAVTVAEMVMLGRIPHRRAFEADSDEDHEIVAAALERVGCTPLVGRSFHTLSGGAVPKDRRRLAQPPAVRNGCIIQLAYDEVTPSPRNAEAVTAIARLLHPTAFGLPGTPADG